MSNFTFSSEDFKTVHNALCEVRSVCERLEGVMNPELYNKLVKARNDLSRGLNNVYEQESTAFESKSDHFTSVQEELGLSAIWSIYEVDNLNDRHPFFGATKVHYKDHWGKPVTKDIVGATWAALYVAGNAAIRDSGDSHHVFIEQFEPSKTDSNVLIMQTGS
jgi:hypothetical protein